MNKKCKAKRSKLKWREYVLRKAGAGGQDVEIYIHPNSLYYPYYMPSLDCVWVGSLWLGQNLTKRQLTEYLVECTAERLRG